MSRDGSSIRSAAARLTKVSSPAASMAQTPSPMLSVIEESRSRSTWTCWYSSALLSAPLPTAARACSRPWSASSNGSSRRRPDATSHCRRPATVIGAASWSGAGSSEVRMAPGLRSSRRTASRIVSSTACWRRPRLASRVTSYSPFIRPRSCSAANRALMSRRCRISAGTARATAHGWAWIARARITPASAPAPASVTWIGRSLVNSRQVVPIEMTTPAIRSC